MNVPELKAEMARHNLSQTDLAKKIGMTKGCLNHKLCGLNRMRLDDAVVISEALDMDASTIMKIFFDWKF